MISDVPWYFPSFLAYHIYEKWRSMKATYGLWRVLYAERRISLFYISSSFSFLSFKGIRSMWGGIWTIRGAKVSVTMGRFLRPWNLCVTLALVFVHALLNERLGDGKGPECVISGISEFWWAGYLLTHIILHLSPPYGVPYCLAM